MMSACYHLFIPTGTSIIVHCRAFAMQTRHFMTATLTGIMVGMTL